MEPRVVQADNAGLFTLSGTRTHLVGRREVVVVDPGPSTPRHLARLHEALEGAIRVTVVATHLHADHVEAVLPLARSLEAGAVAGVEEVEVRLPGAPGGPAGSGSGGPGGTRSPGPAAGAALFEGERIPTDQGTLRTLWTPGHAFPHYAFLHEESGVLFPGDLLLGEGSTAWVGSYAGCVSDYLASLDRLAELGPTRILPAHGPPLEDPQRALERFRTHRLRRIGEVASALEEEPGASVDRLVDRIYGPSLPAGLRGGARWSVHALLDHLGARPFPEGAPLDEG